VLRRPTQTHFIAGPLALITNLRKTMKMKRVILLSLIIFIASYAVIGQQFSIGIKPNFLIINAKYIENPNVFNIHVDSRPSFGFGFTLRKSFIDQLAIQLEPTFIEKGYNLDWGGGNYDAYKNDYISFPTLLIVTPFKNFNLELGPELSYLVSSKINFSYGLTRNNTSKDIHRFEASLVFGLSYSFFKRFDLGIRYGLGIIPYAKGLVVISDTSPLPEYKVYNRYFELSCNIRILTLGKK